MQCWMVSFNAFFVSQHIGTQQVCLFYSRQLWYCYGTIMPYSLIRSITKNEAVKDSYLAFVTISIRTCTRCFDFILDWSQHHIICCLPQFHSHIHDPSVWRLQLQHRQNKFHQACREAVIHWSVTVIWNLIYLPRQPGWRCVMCQDVLTDLSIAQTLVNNAVLKMRYILYQWDRSDHLDYTEMPTVPFWSVLFWCLILVHKYVKHGLWHSVFRNVNKYKKIFLIIVISVKSF